MMEYQDGSFGPIKETKDLLRELQENQELLQNVKAIHFGATKDDLEGLQELTKKENDIETRFAMIASHIAGIEMDVNKILIHLGLDDKTKILPVKP